MTVRALVRSVSASFAQAIAAAPPEVPIDVGAARLQHAAYRSALETLGVTVEALPVEDGMPDACFVEDQAVVRRGVALITRSGAPERRAEASSVRRALGRHLRIAEMEAPATLDGGDVLVLGDRMFVGRSARTNADGIRRLEAVFAPLGFRVIPVALPEGVLHLKSACAPLGDDAMTLAEGVLARAAFGGVGEIVDVPAAEAAAANVLAVERGVLVAEGFPRTREAIERSGRRTVRVDNAEFRKADGALTCLSILF